MTKAQLEKELAQARFTIAHLTEERNGLVNVIGQIERRNYPTEILKERTKELEDKLEQIRKIVGVGDVEYYGCGEPGCCG
jgi:hypothetical protein